MAGWVMYGAALNEGRELYPGKENDRAFGFWARAITSPNLGDIHDDDRAAAMWAAKDPDTFTATRRLHPNVRTVRGLHAKWKEGKQPQPKPTREVPTDDEPGMVHRTNARGRDHKSGTARTPHATPEVSLEGAMMVPLGGITRLPECLASGYSILFPMA